MKWGGIKSIVYVYSLKFLNITTDFDFIHIFFERKLKKRKNTVDFRENRAILFFACFLQQKKLWEKKTPTDFFENQGVSLLLTKIMCLLASAQKGNKNPRRILSIFYDMMLSDIINRILNRILKLKLVLKSN